MRLVMLMTAVIMLPFQLYSMDDVHKADLTDGTKSIADTIKNLPPVRYTFKHDATIKPLTEADFLEEVAVETPLALFSGMIQSLHPLLKKEAWGHFEQQHDLKKGNLSIEDVQRVAFSYLEKQKRLNI